MLGCIAIVIDINDHVVLPGPYLWELFFRIKVRIIDLPVFFVEVLLKLERHLSLVLPILLIEIRLNMR